MVYIAPARGTAAAAVVADLVGGGDARPVLRSSGQPERLSWCRFVSDTRLICGVRATGNIQGRLVNFSRIFAVSVDGSNIRDSANRNRPMTQGCGNSPGAYSTGCHRMEMPC